MPPSMTSCSPCTKRSTARSAATFAASRRLPPRKSMGAVYDTRATVPAPMAVRTGLMRVLDGDSRALAGKRIGLLVNPTAVDAQLRHVVDRIHAMPGVELVCLFGPEHGVRGDAQDMVGVGEARDSVTGLP